MIREDRGSDPTRHERRRGARRVLVFLALTSVGVASCAVIAETQAVIQPRPTMQLVFDEMKRLVPLGLDPAAWEAPENRDEISQALDRLDRAASALERHGRGREAGFDELALTLGRDLRAARDNFDHGRFEEARFFLTGSLQSCVSCHTRLPNPSDVSFTEALTSEARVQALDDRERAWLSVMVRRFDDALALWEQALANPDTPAAQLDASGALVDFLNVAIRVRTDLPRARAALDRFAERPDVPVYLNKRLDTWRTALAALDDDELAEAGPGDVDRGAALAREAGRLAAGPYGRDGLVHDLAASSHLVRFLEADRARRAARTRNPTPAERMETARAYYWLGIVEARSLDGFWINLSERHFEAAIRADPKGPFAERAYAQLEETQVLGYGGASGTDLPIEVWTRLRELRELMGLEGDPPPVGAPDPTG
ncbi:MAG: hypothetical protein AAGC67_09745 [Myxococcota bacterium]